MEDCTIVILTYKGKHHLEHLLPTVREAINRSEAFKVEVLIVDNGKDETTRSYVSEYFPEFKLVWSEQNAYLFSLNSFISKLSSEFILMLNDDMKLHPEVLKEGLGVLKQDAKLFALACRVLDWEGENDTISVRKASYERGWLRSWFVPFKDEQLRFTLYGGGGATFYRTKLFNKLGGFNDLFKPAYVEDLDLGHRAWHHAWPTVIHPKAVLYHREGGTIHDQFSSDDLEQKVSKNNILWMLRNGRKRGFLMAFFVLFPWRLIKWSVKHPNLFKAMLRSIPLWGKALSQRFSAKPPVINDLEIFEKLDTVYEFKR